MEARSSLWIFQNIVQCVVSFFLHGLDSSNKIGGIENPLLNWKLRDSEARKRGKKCQLYFHRKTLIKRLIQYRDCARKQVLSVSKGSIESRWQVQTFGKDILCLVSHSPTTNLGCISKNLSLENWNHFSSFLSCVCERTFFHLGQVIFHHHREYL